MNASVGNPDESSLFFSRKKGSTRDLFFRVERSSLWKLNFRRSERGLVNFMVVKHVV